MGDLKTIDIVFATTSQTNGEIISPGPIQTPTQLYQGIYIGLQSKNLWKEVYTACRPRGYSFDPTPQFGQLYAFCNDNPANPSEYNWDPDKGLATSVVLSRLIHPTSTGFEYSARVVLSLNSQIKQIIPGPVSGLLAQAYTDPPVTRNWFTDNDVSALRILLASFYANSVNLPSRIQRALWNHEYAAAIQ